MSGPTIFLSAGEASGEHYGTSLIHAIRELAPEATLFGLGGERMEAAGLKRIVRAEDVAVMGITEVIRHMPRIYGEYRKLKRSLKSQPQLPDAAVLIDFPDVNLGLARELHRLGIPVIFFVSPQLWAWKKHRIHQVKRYVDKMLVIFPFEEDFYQGHGVEVTFVGHPLADLPLPTFSRAELAVAHSLDSAKLWIALLPGSRQKEIDLNLPTMLDAAAQLGEDVQFLLPIAPMLSLEYKAKVSAIVESLKPRVTLVHDARAALFHARASVVASGTATVEAALIGNPFLVVYRISDLSYAVAKRVVKVPFVAMVNLIAGREVVPELIQGDFTSANVVLHLRRLMHNENDRERMKEDLRRVAASLHFDDANGGPGDCKSAIARVAEITVDLISRERAGSARQRLKSTSKPLSQAE
jgi:lipid-A-disaccharide synthase